ncbi:MAG: hypothetical protein IPO72_16455 [Saprospiraceae bacterium]|nr:hypothetical protein [Candidatus Vicinibacter affinis]
MKTSNNSYYWFALFVLCFITYQQVIDNIRPNYSGNNLTVKYLLGIAPNFFLPLESCSVCYFNSTNETDR